MYVIFNMKQSLKVRRMNKVETVMREFKRKKLKTPQGRIVRKRRQAVAIALSEARQLK